MATVRTVGWQRSSSCRSCRWQYSVYEEFVLLWRCRRFLVVDIRTGHWGVWGRPTGSAGQEGNGERVLCIDFNSVRLVPSCVAWSCAKGLSQTHSRLLFWVTQSSHSPHTNSFSSPSSTPLSHTKRTPLQVVKAQHMPNGPFASLSLIRHQTRAVSVSQYRTLSHSLHRLIYVKGWPAPGISSHLPGAWTEADGTQAIAWYTRCGVTDMSNRPRS